MSSDQWTRCNIEDELFTTQLHYRILSYDLPFSPNQYPYDPWDWYTYLPIYHKNQPFMWVNVQSSHGSVMGYFMSFMSCVALGFKRHVSCGKKTANGRSSGPRVRRSQKWLGGPCCSSLGWRISTRRIHGNGTYLPTWMADFCRSYMGFVYVILLAGIWYESWWNPSLKQKARKLEWNSKRFSTKGPVNNL